MTEEFAAFPKMPRMSRECFITEKIDGTNAQICIEPVPADFNQVTGEAEGIWQHEDKIIRAGSRTRWIMPGKLTDNYGFAQWVFENRALLVRLGYGRHYGEWWGSGIQRAYGFNKGERFFSLFNPPRYAKNPPPDICRIVPVVYKGVFDTTFISGVCSKLLADGSVAAPGFLNPEGIIIYHEAARMSFKKTLVDDEKPKGEA